MKIGENLGIYSETCLNDYCSERNSWCRTRQIVVLDGYKTNRKCSKWHTNQCRITQGDTLRRRGINLCFVRKLCTCTYNKKVSISSFRR